MLQLSGGLHLRLHSTACVDESWKRLQARSIRLCRRVRRDMGNRIPFVRPC